MRVQVLESRIRVFNVRSLAGLFNDQLRYEIEFIQLEIHYDDMYLNGKSLKEMTEILNKNGFVLEAKVKHGFGNFEDVVFRRQNNREPRL